ncbi:MAG: DNA polymerase III subunit delta' [Parcubacteria group bacterium Athens0714_24]|nr:MAG: DNA polymerase III subunit delta' [Parcubacteria group bacterium Athens0714_24]
MKSILDFHIGSENFHHGYLLMGNLEESKKIAFETARVILDKKDKLETHPDFFYEKYDLFGIDDSHEIIGKASKRPLVGDKKVFILETNGFSIESANALLKTFEEPYEGTHFFILLPSLDDVLPTLRSRLVVINTGRGNIEPDEEKEETFEKFLKSNAEKRLEIIKEFSDDRFTAMEFLNGLEIIINKNKEKLSALNEIGRCRSFLLSRGASAKMVLEHIALALPKI